MKKLTIAAMITLMTITTAGVFTGCGISDGKDIGRDAALNAALDDAGVSEDDTTRLRVSSERDDGRKIYEVQFDVNGTEYEYEIAASDGTILSSDTERISNGNGTGEGNAQNDAAQDSGAQNQDTQNDGVQNANGGNNGAQNGNGKNGVQNGAGKNGMKDPAVSVEEATAIALERVAGATESDIRIEWECDDGRCSYEGDIIYEGKEYEFEIDANTGTILEWSEERY